MHEMLKNIENYNLKIVREKLFLVTFLEYILHTKFRLEFINQNFWY